MIARRQMLLAFLGAAGLAVVGGVAYEAGLFSAGYPKTPYDDLLAKLPDRAKALRIGKAYLSNHPGFDAKAAAASLRKRLNDDSLGNAINADVANGDIAEVKGWVMPGSLAQLSALAAQ